MAKTVSEMTMSSDWQGCLSDQMLKTLGLAFIAIVLFSSTVIRPDLMSMIKGDSSDLKSSHDASVCTEQLLIEIDNMEPSKFLAQGKIDEAIGEAVQLLKEKPYDVKRVMCAGNILTKVGDKERGLQLLKKTPYLAPQSRYVRLNYARRLNEAKRYHEATEQYKILTNTFPRLWDTPRLELARLFVETKQFALATDEFRAILQYDSNNGSLRKELGLAMAAQGEVKEGYNEFLRGFACELNLVDYPPVIRQQIEQNDGSVEKTILKLRADVIARPEQKIPRLLLGKLLLSTGRTSDAKDVLVEAIANHYSDPELHQILAQVFHRLNDLDRSLSEFRLAVNLRKKR